jgi:hypothetical protein
MTDGPRVEAATIAAARERHEGFRAARRAVGATPLPYEQLSERTRRIQLDQLRGTIAAALAAADQWDAEHGYARVGPFHAVGAQGKATDG